MKTITNSLESRLIEYFVSLSEQDFTKKILIPLYKQMGYHPVDYYGGINEGGKDLICWKLDDFDEKNLTVVQVKKTKASAAAKNSNSFSEIVNQLFQAKEKKVASLDGIERLPDSVVFITHYQIDTRALESRFQGLQAARPLGAKVYDGTYIATQLAKRLPNLVIELLGESFNLDSVQPERLSNIPLLNSLLYKKEKDYKSFYIDLDFGVGKINSTVFLEWDFYPHSQVLEFPLAEYKIFKDKVKEYEDFFDVSCLSTSWERVELQYAQKFKEWSSKSNRDNLDLFKESNKDLKSLKDGLIDALSSLIASLSTRFKMDISELEDDPLEQSVRESHTELSKILTEIQSFNSNEFFINYTLKNETYFSELIASVHGILNNSITFNTQRNSKKINDHEVKQVSALILSTDQNLDALSFTARKIKELSSVLKYEPNYEVTLNCSALAQSLIDRQSYLRGALSSFQKNDSYKAKLKGLLVEFSEIFKKLDGLLNDRILSEALNPVQKQLDISTLENLRNNLPIFDVFRTGINVAILGDAGAGKSTTLEMYARQAVAQNTESQLTIYFPLTKVIDPNKTSELDSFISFELGVLNYINQSLKSSFSINEFRSAIEKYSEVTFIFDGVDEVFKTAPWIIDGINKFSDHYSEAQVIISSRLGGSYLSQIKFLTITVLPFTDTQLLRFIEGWFEGEPEKVYPIDKHLKANAAVRDVVRNPLLATILCILAENNIPLPTKEISLYRERSKLLFGHYDIHKQTSRVESHHELLEDVARKVAFKLHSSNKRMASKSQLVNIAKESLEFVYNEDEIQLAVSELISACNIIVEMSASGEFGFGHLRFQEHLAAEEIVKNRGIDITAFLVTPWWRSVMVLFAQMTDNLAAILDSQLDKYAGIGRAHETLVAMLNARPTQEYNRLYKIINQYKRLDDLEVDDWDIYS